MGKQKQSALRSVGEFLAAHGVTIPSRGVPEKKEPKAPHVPAIVVPQPKPPIEPVEPIWPPRVGSPRTEIEQFLDIGQTDSACPVCGRYDDFHEPMCPLREGSALGALDRFSDDETLPADQTCEICQAPIARGLLVCDDCWPFLGSEAKLAIQEVEGKNLSHPVQGTLWPSAPKVRAPEPADRLLVSDFARYHLLGDREQAKPLAASSDLYDSAAIDGAYPF